MASCYCYVPLPLTILLQITLPHAACDRQTARLCNNKLSSIYTDGGTALLYFEPKSTDRPTDRPLNTAPRKEEKKN